MMFTRGVIAGGLSLCLVLHASAETQAQTPSQPQAAAQPSAGYKLQPGDILELSVVGLPDFRSKSVVDPDGKIVLPMMRPTKVAGLDLETVLQRRRDRLLGVDVLLGLGDLARERQMLLVWHGEDHAFDLRVGEHGLRRAVRRVLRTHRRRACGLVGAP